MTRHTISILVNDQFGVLARIAGLFASRGYNIQSLSVAPTMEDGISRITIVTSGSEEILEQINKQLNKLIDVIKVLDLEEVDHVDRELLLIKVNADSKNRSEILRIVSIFRSRVIDVSPKSYIIEVTGTESKCKAFIDLLAPLGIIEIVRTGKVAITRGQQRLRDLSIKKKKQKPKKSETSEPLTDGVELA